MTGMVLFIHLNLKTTSLIQNPSPGFSLSPLLAVSLTSFPPTTNTAKVVLGPISTAIGCYQA